MSQARRVVVTPSTGRRALRRPVTPERSAAGVPRHVDAELGGEGPAVGGEQVASDGLTGRHMCGLPDRSGWTAAYRPGRAVLHIHRAERADGLIEALCSVLAHPLPDPFAPEVVCVPTRGMERWLTQRMSAVLGASPGRADGVCANVDFPSPRRIVQDAVATAAGIDPDEDAWLPERMVWPLLEVVDAALQEPWLASLANHLGAEGQARRFAGVRHIAELFDRYALHRPAMVR